MAVRRQENTPETQARPIVVRSSAGLRDALFDEIEGLRNGTTTPKVSNAVARLSGEIVRTVSMELEVSRQHARSSGTQGVPQSVQLGVARLR